MQIKSTKSKSKTDHETRNYVNLYLCVGQQAQARRNNIYAGIFQCVRCVCIGILLSKLGRVDVKPLDVFSVGGNAMASHTGLLNALSWQLWQSNKPIKLYYSKCHVCGELTLRLVSFHVYRATISPSQPYHLKMLYCIYTHTFHNDLCWNKKHSLMFC